MRHPVAGWYKSHPVFVGQVITVRVFVYIVLDWLSYSMVTVYSSLFGSKLLMMVRFITGPLMVPDITAGELHNETLNSG